MFKIIKTPEQVTAEEAQKKLEQIQAQRKVAYIEEADPLFFKYQRGEATKQEWLDKVTEIKERFSKE